MDTAASPAPGAWNLATAFESVCDALPDRVALIQGDRRVTWRAFDERAARIAAAFTAAGLRPGSKVASYLYNCNEYTEALYGTFKMRGVPANVNYRYLEDELVYLLDNSDAEALLFHGSLGDHVAKIRDRAPKVKIWIQVDDGSPHQEFAVEYEELLARARSDGTDRAQRRRPLLPVHRRHDRHAEGRDVAHRRPVRRPRRRRVPARRAGPARDHGRGRAGREGARRRRCEPRAPARVAADARHRRRSRPSRRSSSVPRSARSSGRHFDPDELWATVQRERVTQMAIVGDAFAKPMLRALEEAEAKGDAVRHLVAAADHQLGRDVVVRGEARPHAAGQVHLPRLAGIERGRRVRGLDQRPRLRAEDGEVHDRHEHEGLRPTGPGGRRRARARSAGSRSAGTSRSATTRIPTSRTRRSSPSTARAGRSPATSRASRPTARSRCSAAARSSSTRAARRSSPRRSKRR